MNMSQRSAAVNKTLSDIKNELEHAFSRFGADFDNKNTINDWAAYINIYLGKATSMKMDSEPVEAMRHRQRQNLLKAAGLAVSAIVAFDCNYQFPNRHYDSDE